MGDQSITFTSGQISWTSKTAIPPFPLVLLFDQAGLELTILLSQLPSAEITSVYHLAQLSSTSSGPHW
jgi:hypothetical protein